MDAFLAVVTLLGTVTLAILAGWLLTRLIRTVAELRKITTGMHAMLGWTVGQVLADPPGVDRAPAGGSEFGSG